MRAGPPIADLIAGLQGALGICAALVRRGRTGRGETVGASLNNAMISTLGFLAANYFATGEPPARSGNDHAIVSPYGMFRTADGEIAIAPSQEQSYQRLIDALDMPELREHPDFRTNDLRVKNRAGDQCRDRKPARGTLQRLLDRQTQRRRRSLRPRKSIARSLRRPADYRAGDGDRRRPSRPWRGQDARLPGQIRRGAVPAPPPRPRSRRRHRRGLARARLFGRGHRPDCAKPEPFEPVKA